MADGDKTPEDKPEEKRVPARRAPAKAEPKPEPEKAPEPQADEVKPVDEGDDRLDNRKGDQAVAKEAWAATPQQVDGGEVSDKRKLDTNDG